MSGQVWGLQRFSTAEDAPPAERHNPRWIAGSSGWCGTWSVYRALFTKQDKPLRVSLMEAAKVSIREWGKIRSEAHPYDPSWELYLEARQRWKREQTLAGRKRIAYLWEDQGGRCVVCRQPLLVEASAWWHLHPRRWRSHGGADTADNLELLHAPCHRQLPACAQKTATDRVSPEALAKA